ncbi:MAG: sigma-70 family RNA polymerase sigma factor [Myxococcales bacterium]|nr:sigma-70 family RNA polymerase sigma factor [Myxococcales bacterium]
MSDSEHPGLDPDNYEHLKALARRIYAERGSGHATMQPTILLHEAWMKLDSAGNQYASKAHFVAVAAKAMRQILIDRARAKSAAKRGENPVATTLSGIPGDAGTFDVLDLDRVLDELEAVDARAAEITVMRTFGGMTVSEIAEATEMSQRSVERSWRFARAFLGDRLS